MKLPNVFARNSKTQSVDPNNFIVLDLTSTSVKSLFVRKLNDGGLTVKGVSTRESYNVPLKTNEIKSAVTECLDQAGLESGEAIVGLSGPKTMGFILIARSQRDDPQSEITSEEMDKLYERIKTAAYNQAKQRWEMFFAESAGFEPLDVVVTSIHVDDNQVDVPEGAKGSSIQVTVYCSYAEDHYYKQVMDILEELKFSTITVTTTIYSQSKLISEKEKNFLLIDIGKEHTDIAVVFGKNIIQTRSFDLGGDYFTEYIMDREGLDAAQAKAKKEAYELHSLHDEEADRIGDLVYEAGKDWRLAFATALSTMTGIKSFPKSLYITGGGAALPVIEELLYEETWCQGIPFSGDLELHRKAMEKLWSGYLTDELNILNEIRMFPPASLAVIKLEIESQDE